VNDDLIDEMFVGSPRHAANASPAGRVHWFEVATLATSVEPDAHRGSGLAIQAIRPNPAHERLRVWFVLPVAAPARLDLIDVTGRRVMSHDLGTLAPGLHDAPLADARELRPGLYLVRLSQGSAIATGKVSIVR
jgi:hypothetical protein